MRFHYGKNENKNSYFIENDILLLVEIKRVSGSHFSFGQSLMYLSFPVSLSDTGVQLVAYFWPQIIMELETPSRLNWWVWTPLPNGEWLRSPFRTLQSILNSLIDLNQIAKLWIFSRQDEVLRNFLRVVKSLCPLKSNLKGFSVFGFSFY